MFEDERTEVERLRWELSESKLAESIRIRIAQQLTAERDEARAVAEEYKCQLAVIVEKNRNLGEDYENLLKKVGEQVAVIGRLKADADEQRKRNRWLRNEYENILRGIGEQMTALAQPFTTKHCPRCANLEAVLRSIRQSLSRRLDTAHFHSAEHGEAFCDALAMVNDYMAAVGVEPLPKAKEEAPDVAI